MNIAILHYAYTPVIGGVEFIMEQHAALFARHGYAVRVICGADKCRRVSRAPPEESRETSRGPPRRAPVGPGSVLASRSGAEHLFICI